VDNIYKLVCNSGVILEVVQMEYQPMNLESELGDVQVQSPVGSEQIAVLLGLNPETVFGHLRDAFQELKSRGVTGVVVDLSQYPVGNRQTDIAAFNGIFGIALAMDDRYAGIKADELVDRGDGWVGYISPKLAETIDEAVTSLQGDRK
jgi:hypothetical protein